MRNEGFELLCFGNAVVDVFARAEAWRLDELGIRSPVQHIPRDQAQRLLDEFNKPESDAVIASGGAAANVAKIAAMLNISAAFTGCVGRDELAVVFENELRSAGVIPLLSAAEEKTGICFAFNCGGEANEPAVRIAASPGAALEFSATDVREDLITGAEAIVLDGYMLERRGLVQHILQLANHGGIPIALDAASVFQIRDKTEDILQYSRNYPLIVFMNADECIAFYNTIKKGACVEASGEREKEALILKEICPVLKYMTEGDIFPVLVIKLGGRGAIVLAGGNIYREETFTIIPRNTVGAGDAFCAAFMSAWIRGKPIRECAALRNKVAREILSLPGTKIKAGKLRSFAKALKAR
jgi:sugar/nucleoside kinase (ribokinase family)